MARPIRCPAPVTATVLPSSGFWMLDLLLRTATTPRAAERAGLGRRPGPSYLIEQLLPGGYITTISVGSTRFRIARALIERVRVEMLGAQRGDLRLPPVADGRDLLELLPGGGERGLVLGVGEEPMRPLDGVRTK